MSGSLFAKTTSQIAYSATTTLLSRPPPQLGASSSPSPVVSHLSRPEAGPISVRAHEVWYYINDASASLSSAAWPVAARAQQQAAASVIGRIRIWRGRLHITGDGRRAGRVCWPFASQRQPFFSST